MYSREFFIFYVSAFIFGALSGSLVTYTTIEYDRLKTSKSNVVKFYISCVAVIFFLSLAPLVLYRIIDYLLI